MMYTGMILVGAERKRKRSVGKIHVMHGEAIIVRIVISIIAGLALREDAQVVHVTQRLV